MRNKYIDTLREINFGMLEMNLDVEYRSVST